MRRRRFVLFAAVFAVALSSVTIFANLAGQSPQQSGPLFRSGVDLVEVDVAVTDKDGKPIRGLSKDDFVVKNHSIASFQEVAREFSTDPVEREMRALPRDVADNRSAQDATLIALVLDDRIFPEDLATSKTIAHHLVDQLGPGSEVGLLMASGRQAVEITDNRARLTDAIDRLQVNPVTRMLRTSSADVAPCSFETFEQVARQLAPQRASRKAVIAITPFCGAHVTGAINSVVGRATNNSELAAAAMVDAMRRANVAFFAIDPRGAVDFSYSHFGLGAGLAGTWAPGRRGSPLSTSFNPREPAPRTPMRHDDPVIVSQDNLVATATTTGGVAITRTNDIDGGVARIVNDFDHYYLLGFAPANSTSRKFEKLDVTVNRPGAVVRARRGYQLGGEKQTVTLQSVSIAGFVPKPDVPMRLMAMPFAPIAGGAREIVALEVQAPRAVLTAPDGSLEDDVTVTIAAVRSDSARVQTAFKFARHLTLPKDSGGSSPNVSYQIVRSVDLPSGPYQLRVSIESKKLGQSGSVYLSTEVPDYSSASLEISGPLLAYADAGRQPRMLTQVEADTLTFQPVFDRTFASSDRLRVVCPLWRSAQMGSTKAEIELIDHNGHTVAGVAIPAAGDGIAGIDGILSMSGVPPGAYVLRVTATDGAVAASRDTTIAVK